MYLTTHKAKLQNLFYKSHNLNLIYFILDFEVINQNYWLHNSTKRSDKETKNSNKNLKEKKKITKVESETNVGPLSKRIKLEVINIWELWSMASLYLVSLKMPYSVKELLACWKSGFKGHQSVDVQNAIPLCLMWCIWRNVILRLLNGLNPLCFNWSSIFLGCFLIGWRALGLLIVPSFLEFLDLFSFGC